MRSPEATPPLPSPASFNLPLLAFAAPTGRLVACNDAGRAVLGLPRTEGELPELTAQELLRRKSGNGENEQDGRGVAREVRGMLERMARQSDELAWGESVVLEYHRQNGKEERGSKAEVLVAFSRGENDNDGVFSILFLRPAILSFSSLPPFQPAATTPTTASSRFDANQATTPTGGPSSFPSHMKVSPYPAPSPTELLNAIDFRLQPMTTPPSDSGSSLAVEQDGGPARSPSPSRASTSSLTSASTSSSLSKRASRPPTIEDRRNIPLGQDVVQMLNSVLNPVRAHGSASGTLSPSLSATSSINSTFTSPDLSHAARRGSTFSAFAPSLSPLPSEPASPRPVDPLSRRTSTASQSPYFPPTSASPTLPVSYPHSNDVTPTSRPEPSPLSLSETLPPALSSAIDSTPSSRAPSPRLSSPVTDGPLPFSDHPRPAGADVRSQMAFVNTSMGSHRYRLPESEAEAMEAHETGPEQVEGAGEGQRVRTRRNPLPFEKLTAALDTIPQIIFLAEPDGQILWFNDSWYDYCGHSSEYMMDEETWLALFHSDDLPGAFKSYLGGIGRGEPFEFEYRIKNKEGEMLWHVARGRPHRDEHGQIDNYFCTITNVHELVTTRHDALLIKERTQAVLEGSELMLLTVDTAGMVTLCEGRRPSLMPEGRDPTLPIVASKFSDLWPNPQLSEAVRQVLDEEVEVAEVETQTKGAGDQKHYHRYRLVPLRGDPSIPSTHPDASAVTGVIIVGRDITDLVNAEERLEKSRIEKGQLEASEFAANEANRLKTEFLTTVSHEIRTPIASILGICELLLGEQISKEQRVLVEKALQSGENLLDLVGTVLDVRKVETGELTLESAPFHLSDALCDARLFAVSAQKKGLKFVEDVQPFYEGTVLGDRLRLRQILANALSNSVKFTSQGSVSLQLRQIEENASHVTVEFVIEDTGVGISKEVLPTLFVPFRQADASTARQYGGSGLGLTIAKQLVKLMGGNISLTSPGVNQGSRMTVRVPLEKAPLLDKRRSFVFDRPLPPLPPYEASAPSSPVPSSFGSDAGRRTPEDVRVLLAEDNELIREIVTKTLRKMKFQIDAVNDGGQALEKVENEHYDVVLMDGQMPIMDGYAATASIRKHPDPRVRNLRIIALTASAIAGDRERCLQSGMNSYLAKPVRAKELEAAIWQEIELAESATAPNSTPAA
ncbi:hypothetical protein JCM8547_007154 [Rhodosporidiobolus lusitaniae]